MDKGGNVPFIDKNLRIRQASLTQAGKRSPALR